MKFNAGDRVRLIGKDAETINGDIPFGGVGTLIAVHYGLALVSWDHEVPKAYNAFDRLGDGLPSTLVWGVRPESLEFENSKATPIERKIRLMESRWKTFQQRKQQALA